MKNTRRFLAAVMALAMISAMAPISASARGGGESVPAGTSLTENGASADTNVKYSVDPSYTVVIPADVTLLDDKDVTKDIYLDNSAPFKLAKGEKLSVKIANVDSNDFTVKNGDESVNYTVKVNGNALAKGGTAAEFAEGNTGAKTLTFPKMENKAKYAGEYTGTLTFSIAVEAAPTTVVTPTTTLSDMFENGAVTTVYFKWRGSNAGDYVSGTYDGSTFTASKGGDYFGMDDRAQIAATKDGNKLILQVGLYDFDGEAMSFILDADTDTYSVTYGDFARDMNERNPGLFDLVSIKLNDVDITNKLTRTN